LQRLEALLAKGLEATAPFWPDLRQAYAWVRQAAHILGDDDDDMGGSGEDRQVAYRALLTTVAAGRDAVPTLNVAITHVLTVTDSYWAGLFPCYAAPDLPRTNNDLEQYFGTARYHERRATGRTQASSTFVIRAAVRVVAAVATQSQFFSAADLRPHDLHAWEEVRQSVQYRHTIHRAQRRFQRDPAAYLAALEDLLLKGRRRGG